MCAGVREMFPTCGYLHLLMTLTGLQSVQGFKCLRQSDRLADNTINTISSPHAFHNSIDSCQWRIKSSKQDHIVYIRVNFPKYLGSMRDCTMTYVDIFDGPDVTASVLGRWCDMNSTLMISTGTQVTVMSQSSGVRFDFEILYCLDPFTRPDHTENNPRSLTTLEIAGIAISSFLFLFILCCFANKYFKQCSKCQHRRSSNNPNEPTVTFSREENLRYTQGPPDYWTVVNSGNTESNKHDSSDEQPPSYSDVLAAAPY